MLGSIPKDCLTGLGFLFRWRDCEKSREYATFAAVIDKITNYEAPAEILLIEHFMLGSVPKDCLTGLGFLPIPLAGLRKIPGICHICRSDRQNHKLRSAGRNFAD